jgi:hypothetical protein
MKLHTKLHITQIGAAIHVAHEFRHQIKLFPGIFMQIAQEIAYEIACVNNPLAKPGQN